MYKVQNYIYYIKKNVFKFNGSISCQNVTIFKFFILLIYNLLWINEAGNL